MTRQLRNAGSKWRLLVHEPHGTSHHVAHDAAFGGRFDGEYTQTHVIAGTEFDELVVGHWIHVEQMDTGYWWMNIGGVTVHVRADRDGRPREVTVHGPNDYASPESDCKYTCIWTD